MKLDKEYTIAVTAPNTEITPEKFVMHRRDGSGDFLVYKYTTWMMQDGTQVWAGEGYPEGMWKKVRGFSDLENPELRKMATGFEFVPPMATKKVYAATAGQEIADKVEMVTAASLGNDDPANWEGVRTAILMKATGLPAGVTLDTDGNFHGVPMEAGDYEFTVIAKNPAGDARLHLVLQVRP